MSHYAVFFIGLAVFILGVLVNAWFPLCKHDWKLEFSTDYKDSNNDSWTRRLYVCTKCGKFKQFDL